MAVGCYVQTGQETVEKDDCIDLAVGNNRKKDLVSILEKFIEERRKGNQDKTLGNQTVPDLHKPVPYEEMTLKKTGDIREPTLKYRMAAISSAHIVSYQWREEGSEAKRPETLWRRPEGWPKQGTRKLF